MNTVITSVETREVRVLLVEDSPEERRLISLELSEIQEPHFRCTEASRLSEADCELHKGRTDVVLLDLSLPDSVGLKGLTRLCREHPSLPIVVYTGLDDQEVALQALRQGGQDFLVKGQTRPAMLRRVLLHAIERKRVDVALTCSHESLREAQRLETLGRLAGKIAHDFNNILTTIVGYAELLLESLGDHACADDLLEIQKAGKRGVVLTSNILSYSRKEASSVGALSLNEAVSGLTGMLKQLLPKSVTLSQKLQADLPLALGNIGQVEQALVNLVVNARDAMPSGGIITVRSQIHTVSEPSLSFGDPPKAGTYVALVVEDTGAGMDAVTLDRIFEPFFTTKPRGAGTGLGLSTVAGIARRFGGGIEVQSSLGCGTRFILSFPTVSVAEPRRAAFLDPEELCRLDRPEEDDSPLSLAMTKLTSEYALELDNAELPWGIGRDDTKEHLRHLYYVVSHDFHEPLRMVSSYLKLLKRRGGDSLPRDYLEFLDYALEGSQRLQGMLDGVLRYSRALQASPRADRTPVSDVYPAALNALPGSEIVSWIGDQPVLLASSDHFTIILRELLSNALKFAKPQEPEVWIEYRRDAHHGVFEFHDNGTGIPPDATEKCFRLFGRLHGRDEYAGLGVGLSIAQVLIEKYGALLRVRHGGGGCVVLEWPANKILLEEVSG